MRVYSTESGALKCPLQRGSEQDVAEGEVECLGAEGGMVNEVNLGDVGTEQEVNGDFVSRAEHYVCEKCLTQREKLTQLLGHSKTPHHNSLFLR